MPLCRSILERRQKTDIEGLKQMSGMRRKAKKDNIVINCILNKLAGNAGTVACNHSLSRAATLDNGQHLAGPVLCHLWWSSSSPANNLSPSRPADNKSFLVHFEAVLGS